MLLSIYSQISLIGFAAIALVYCAVGYKFARFLLPVCGVFILEVALYLFVADTLGANALSGALFYGGTAVLFYVALFFSLRVSGFFTGIVGAALFLIYVIFTFGIALPYLMPICFMLCLMTGLLSAAYSRVGIIVASSLLGGSLATGVLVFLVLSAGVQAAEQVSMLSAMFKIFEANAFIFLGASAVVVALSIVIQLKFTGFRQVLGKRAAIRYQVKPMQYRMDSKKSEARDVR